MLGQWPKMSDQEEEGNLLFPCSLGSIFWSSCVSSFWKVFILTSARWPQTLSLTNTNSSLGPSRLEMVAPHFLLLLIGGRPPCLVWLLRNSLKANSCYCFCVTRYPRSQWLNTPLQCVRNLERHGHHGLSLVHSVGASAGKTDAEGDVTPAGGWNRLKVIYAHVCCPGCDDSKARTAGQSTHTGLPTWRDFLTARQPGSSQLAPTAAPAPKASQCSSRQQTEVPFYVLISDAAEYHFPPSLLVETVTYSPRFNGCGGVGGTDHTPR